MFSVSTHRELQVKGVIDGRDVVRNLGSKVLTKLDEGFRWYINTVQLFALRVGTSGRLTVVLGHRRVFRITHNQHRTQ